MLVTLAGEIDFSVVTGLRERLFALATSGRHVVADLDRVSFIDAAGLGVLAGAARRAAVHGATLHVVCARRQTRRLFRYTGLDQAWSRSPGAWPRRCSCWPRRRGQGGGLTGLGLDRASASRGGKSSGELCAIG